MYRRVGTCMRSAAVLGNVTELFLRVYENRRTHISMEQQHFPVSAHPSHFPVSQNTKLHHSERRRMLKKIPVAVKNRFFGHLHSIPPPPLSWKGRRRETLMRDYQTTVEETIQRCILRFCLAFFLSPPSKCLVN